MGIIHPFCHIAQSAPVAHVAVQPPSLVNIFVLPYCNYYSILNSWSGMFPNIEFNEAAFKHGITESNIRYAMWHPLYEELLEKHVNKWLIIGYDTAGSLIEIAYNIIDDETVNVFHAMPCRKKFIKELLSFGQLPPSE
jgi:hypothetical protein